MGNSFTSPALPDPPETTNTATETAWTCPMCCYPRTNTAFILPCLEHLCLCCTLKWANRTCTCPVCSTPMMTIKFATETDRRLLELFIRVPPQTSRQRSQADQAPPQLHSSITDHSEASPPASPQEMPSLEEQGAAGTEARATVGGLLPEEWKELFRHHQCLIDPAVTWLRQELKAIYQHQWWMANQAEKLITYTLCYLGLDEEALVRLLQPKLGEYIAPLLHNFINVIVEWCSEEAWRLKLFYPPTDDDKPAARPQPSEDQRSSPTHTVASSSRAEGSNTEEQSSTSQAALYQDPGLAPSETIPMEQEQPHEEPHEEPVPGPSGQDSSPPAPGQARPPLAEGAQRPPKRRASDSQDSPQPCKRPHHQDH